MQVHTLTAPAGTATVVTDLPIEHLQAAWVAGCFFEADLLEYIYSHYRGGTFIDVGAALGNHALYFALFCDVRRVIAIEPVRDSCAHQHKVYALNGVQDTVRVYPCAVSNVPRYGAMERFGSNRGQYRLVRGDDVTVETLDNIVAEERADDVTLVKVDVEGHELRVLKGARQLLERQHPALFIEIRTRRRHAQVTEFLSGYGYRQVGDVHAGATVFEFVAEGGQA